MFAEMLRRNVSLIVSIQRHIRGYALTETVTPSIWKSDDSFANVRYGYGIKRSDELEKEHAGQRLASFYGHPRRSPVPEATFDFEAEKMEMRDVKEREEEIVDTSSIGTGTNTSQLGGYTPLAEPIPAPKRKPRSVLRTYTLTTLVNDCELLRNLVDIGVDLCKLDSLYNVADWILKLDWEKDVRPVLGFLCEICGVPMETLGSYITGNPWILQQSLNDLRIRIGYLESKKFSKEAIARIITRARYWLNFNVKTIDKRLGYIQETFALTGDQVRYVVTTCPKLITIGTGYTQLLMFMFKEEMGFEMEEMRQLLVKDPKLWSRSKPIIARNFDYLHNKLNFSHKALLAWPRILRLPHPLIRPRFEYLKKLGRDQYDPEKPNYVSLQALSTPDDVVFAVDVAKTSIGEYNKFCKKF